MSHISSFLLFLFLLFQFYDLLAPHGLSMKVLSSIEDAPIAFLEYNLMDFLTGEIQVTD
jgi:uncharacterized membrane protein